MNDDAVLILHESRQKRIWIHRIWLYTYCTLLSPEIREADFFLFKNMLKKRKTASKILIRRVDARAGQNHILLSVLSNGLWVSFSISKIRIEVQCREKN